MRRLYENCGRCEKPIRYGKESVTVPEHGGGGASGAEVPDSDVLLVLCESRGDLLDMSSSWRNLGASRSMA